MYTINDMPASIKYKRLRNVIFKGTTLSAEQEAAVMSVFEYIDRNGLAAPELTGEPSQKAYVNLLDKVTANLYGMSLKDVMKGSRQRRTIMIKSICWNRFMDRFPLATNKETARWLGDGRNHASIHYSLNRFRQDLSYDKDTIREFHRFRKELESMETAQSEKQNNN